MSTIGNTLYTLADWIKMLDPDGQRAALVNILSQTNEILTDMLLMQGNLPTGHRTTVVTGLPTVTWRKLNRGVQPSKFTTVQVDDTCGMCEAIAKADEALVRLNGGTPAARLMEEKPYIEAMNQEMASGMFYSDTDLDPEKFLGLAARYPFSDAPNVIDAGGSGSDVTSIYLVVWGEETVHAMFPKGSKAGLEIRDLGKGEPLLTGDGQTPEGEFLAYVTHYKWDIGLCVRDWRYVVRIANIETAGSENTFDHKDLIEAYNLVPNIGAGKPAIYCNKTIKTQMDIAATDSSNRMFTQTKDAFGRPVTEFFGIPIRKVDAILDTETALAAE